ncbi:TPA: hypothetical protein EYP66_07330 [Candidatus Poribacteria bacterium]|nr:hypothetical protein [Candidatus Poribacteria bacterium]
MLNYRRTSTDRMGFSIPFLKEAGKSLRTLQGKYIIYVIIICSIIGFVIQGPISDALKEHEMSLKGGELNLVETQTVEERATLITMGIVVFLLIAFILSMSRIIKIIEKRRTQYSKGEEHQNFRT